MKVVDDILAAVGREKRHIVPILKELQNRYNYLPEPELRYLCQVTSIRPRDIEGVASFYSQFRTTPAGKHMISVCIGTACFVKGAEGIYDGFREALDIEGGGDTDEDGLFTVEKVACLGCCMLAPAVKIDDKIYGRVTRRNVPSVLAEFLEGAAGNRIDGDRLPENREVAGEVRLCTCTSCRASGALEVLAGLEKEITDGGYAVAVRRVGCSGASYNAPRVEFVTARGEAESHREVTPDQVANLLRRYYRPVGVEKRLAGAARRVVDRLLIDVERPSVDRVLDEERVREDTLFIAPQVRIVTAGAERLAPLSLADYVKSGGFTGLERLLESDDKPAALEILKESGLRGRGGGGFPSYQKWGAVATSPAPHKYVVCNADEGDPGAFMDRMILESFPFRVIEGVVIAAWTVGADRGIVYIRSEYPLAVQTMQQAIHLAEGRIVPGLTLEIREGAGAFVCGEETALIAALEGKRGSPRWRPPYPSERGLDGYPTLINNVETFATIPWIMAHGAEAFRALGTSGSPGTKTFALAGRIMRGGLVEIPLGMTLRQVVEEIGGGVDGGRRLKAIQIGGPSGGCVPAGLAHLPVEFDTLSGIGSMMGSGGMIVLDDTDCMVDIARYFMTFTQSESCGKCTCCRVGTKSMLEILDKLCDGRGSVADIELLETLCGIVSQGSLCGLGRTAPNPVESTLRYFKDEYLAHADGSCPAGKCKALIRFFITDRCIGCTRCAQSCPVDAIESVPYERHTIDPEVCIRCGSCRQVCPSEAVEVR